MLRPLIVLSCALALALLLGCGNKGPLYLPKQGTEPAPEKTITEPD